jgi:hypothetical protein
LVGSLCHDIAHPGLTNTFEIASGSHRALTYNGLSCSLVDEVLTRLAVMHSIDQSVLENHHAYTMFSILIQPECNIFAHMKREQRQELRTIMIKAILATDMSFVCYVPSAVPCLAIPYRSLHMLMIIAL